VPTKPDQSTRKTFKRRSFLELFPSALAGAAFLPLISPLPRIFGQSPNPQPAKSVNNNCWLDVCAPFVVEDAAAGISSEVVLTSDTFIGNAGYRDAADATEYEIYLYDGAGKAVGTDGIARRLTVPAMQTATLAMRDLLGGAKDFWGGMRIRMRPKCRTPTHVSDLFSSAFLRWKTSNSFDNVHANPDPLQWQRADSFFYSMPFPSLDEYQCVFSVFNPYAERSIGTITLYDELGQKLCEKPYDLAPHVSVLFDLRSAEFSRDVKSAFSVSNQLSRRPQNPSVAKLPCGTIAVTNQPGSVKNFAYLLINRPKSSRFTVEHPIHQPPYKPAAATNHFDVDGWFKAKNVLYTPLLFRAKEIGGLTLESRFIFSSGAPMEESLWLKPYVTDGAGNVVWQVTNDTDLPKSIARQQIERTSIKLGGQQTCVFDCSQIALPKNFSGGLSLAVAPNTNHTLMKVGVRVLEWHTESFTHFRPGLASARSYQKPANRGGLATDYVVSSARHETKAGKTSRDEIITILNIDDKGISGQPTLQAFGSSGLVLEVKLKELRPFGSNYYLLSELMSGKTSSGDLTLRLIDERATLLMSVVHLDFARRDLALDHGSDRFSTFSDFSCDASA